VDEAHALVDVAADSGADAVKFQTFDPDRLVSASAAAAPYQRRQAGVGTQLELLRRHVLPLDTWKELQSHARQRGLDFFTTPFDLASLDTVCELGVEVVKLGSGELTDRPLLVEVARRGLPVICSTGMATLEEVEDAVGWLQEAPALALMHCVSSYPAPTDQANLRALQTMSERFDLPVGWSDHTLGSVTAVAAVALGACLLEKHLTTDTSRSGPDHEASAGPEAMRQYVEDVRAAHAALGDGVKRPASAEAENRPLVRRSWHAARDLSPGRRLRSEDLLLLRPADGVPPAVPLEGRTVARHIPRGSPVRPGDLVEAAV
jgi:N-acetylneuraminate synthase/N,N'-diacetyllegionaminate synthase